MRTSNWHHTKENILTSYSRNITPVESTYKVHTCEETTEINLKVNSTSLFPALIPLDKLLNLSVLFPLK